MLAPRSLQVGREPTSRAFSLGYLEPRLCPLGLPYAIDFEVLP
jgi:hypothetical protein